MYLALLLTGTVYCSCLSPTAENPQAGLTELKQGKMHSGLLEGLCILEKLSQLQACVIETRVKISLLISCPH